MKLRTTTKEIEIFAREMIKRYGYEDQIEHAQKFAKEYFEENFERRFGYFMAKEISDELKLNSDYEPDWSDECEWAEIVDLTEKYRTEMLEKIKKYEKEKFAEKI